MSCKHLNGGVCSLGLYGGRPTPGVCRQCSSYDGPPMDPVETTRGTKQKRVRTKEEQEASIERYLRAEASLWSQGPVHLPIYHERESECIACPARDPSGDVIGFCNDCGCGHRERARLSVKLHMPLTTCPRKRWAEAVGEGIAALARLPGGVIGQARSVFRGMRQQAARSWAAWRRRSSS